MSQTNRSLSPEVPAGLKSAAGFSWRVLVVGALVVVITLALARLQLVVLPVVIAILLSTLYVPPARWLARHGWPRGLAAFVVLAIGVLIFTGFLAAIGPEVANEFSALDREVETGLEELSTVLVDGPLGLTEADVDRAVDRLLTELRANIGTITSGVVSGAVLLGELLAGALITLVLLFFFIKDGDRMWRWVVGLFASRRRRRIHRAGELAYETLGKYLRGLSIVATVDTVLIGLALVLIGVPLVVPLMLLTFVGAFFPLVGAFLAGLVAVLVALVDGGIVPALLVLVTTVAVQQLEGDLLYPIVVGRSLSLHPVAILLAITAGAVLFGVIGAFLAPPLTAVIYGTLAYLRDSQPGGPLAGRAEPPGDSEGYPPDVPTGGPSPAAAPAGSAAGESPAVRPPAAVAAGPDPRGHSMTRNPPP